MRKEFNAVLPSDDFLRTMIDQMPTLAWACRPDGSAEFVNQRWLDYTGLSMEEAVGWGWQATIHPEDLGKTMETWLRLIASEEPGEREARVRRFDGEYRWFLLRAVPVRDEWGKVIRWYGTSTDIEDRKQAEEKLRQDERELRRITDAIAQPIGVLAPDGSTLYANQVVLDYAGLSLEDIKADDLAAEITHPDDLARVRDEQQRGLSSGESFQMEQRVRRKDGQYRWFLGRFNPLRDDEGRIIRWYGTGIDIEERKQAEERVQKENVALREEIDHSSMFEEIVGSSQALGKVLAQAAKVAPMDSTVLILGETGTGKELIARAIHKRSKRSARAFIRVNCAAIPTALIASELFGHEKGAFTGAASRRAGCFELAEGGTLLLDEIAEMPALLQSKLLRVIEERSVRRLGSRKELQVDVRLLAATNQDPQDAVSKGSLREDLLYRLNVFRIQLPPLKDRKDDLPLLAQYLVTKLAEKHGRPARFLSAAALEALQFHAWPGNIRELRNVIERAVVICSGEQIERHHFAPYPIDQRERLRNEDTITFPVGTPIEEVERQMIIRTIKKTRNNKTRAAELLGVSLKTLHNKLNLYRERGQMDVDGEDSTMRPG